MTTPEEDRKWTGLMRQLEGVHRLLFMYLKKVRFLGTDGDAVKIAVVDAEQLAELEQGLLQYTESIKRYLPGWFGETAFFVATVNQECFAAGPAVGASAPSTTGIGGERTLELHPAEMAAPGLVGSVAAAVVDGPSGGLTAPAREADPTDLQGLLFKAKERMHDGDHDEGRRLFSAALRLLEHEGTSEQKQACLKDAVKLDPGHLDWQRQLAELQEKRGFLDMAAETFARLGEAMLAAGREEEAGAYSRRAVNLGLHDAGMVLARLALKKGDPTAALGHLNALTHANPRHGEAWTLALEAARLKADPDELMRVGLKACQADLKSPAGFEALAEAFLAKGQEAKAVSMWLQAGEALLALGKVEKAALLIRQAMQREPEHPVAKRLWERVPETAKGRAALPPLPPVAKKEQEPPALPPLPPPPMAADTPKDMAKRAEREVYEATKHLDAAIALYRQAIKLDPNDDELKAKLSKLYKWVAGG